MHQFDPILTMYADAGMKTAEDWAMSGREVVAGAPSRANASHRGVRVELYTRDQTHIRPSARVERGN